MRPAIAFLVAALALTFAGCERDGGASGGPGAPASRPAAGARGPGAAGAVRFEDHAADRGIRFRHSDGSSGKYFIVETLASGVGLFDFDADGRLDIYFPTGRLLPPGSPDSARNALYRQNADGTFTDVAERAGVGGTAFGVGCCVGDYDLDGDLDLYVTQYGPNVLYRNEGDGTFTDVTAAAGVGDDRFGAGACFFDYDLDGDLDLYVANYCFIDFEKTTPCYNNNVPGYCAPSQYRPTPDVLYRNDGGGSFTDVSESAGILAPNPGRGMGIVATDLDGDRYPEVFVANDGSENFLFRNRGDGTFEETGLFAGVAFDLNGDEQGSMGVDIDDYDLDGGFDIVVTNYQKQTNALYRRGEDGSYTDVCMATGIAADALPLVAWGTAFFDFQNDGLLDIFIANGHLEDQIHRYDQSSTYKQRNQLFANVGDGRFEDVTARTGPGLEIVESSRGAAFGDIDNDGDIDIVVCNSRAEPDLLINEGGNRGRWLGLELVGARDRFAIGARVTLHAGGSRQVQEVRSGGSYVSQNDLRVHFGLGAGNAIEKLEILWPDGARETIADVPIDRYSTVVQGKGLQTK